MLPATPRLGSNGTKLMILFWQRSMLSAAQAQDGAAQGVGVGAYRRYSRCALRGKLHTMLPTALPR
jgi:hypothetical protein